MLVGLAMAAALAGEAPAKAVYVADYVPSAALALDQAEVCKEGYVDPDLLAVHLLVQLKMYDVIKTMSAQQALLTFDGRTCDPRFEGQPPKTAGEKGACAAAIVIQRMLLNIYPGYLTVKWFATHPEADALQKKDFRHDVAENTLAIQTGHDDLNRRVDAQKVAALAQRFIDSAGQRDPKTGLAPPIIECDFVKEVPRLDPVTSTIKTDLETFHRGGIIAGTAEGGSRLARGLMYIQFRQFPGNLVYRGAKDTFDQQHATFATGRDLYAADAGLSLTLGKDLGDEASEKYNRTRKESVVGAVGLPLCALFNFNGKDCTSGNPLAPDGDEPRVTWSWDVIPYFALDRGFKKTKQLYSTDPERKDKTGDQTEFGVVTYLATDDAPTNCRFWNALGLEKRLTNCASYYVLRGYSLKNELDGSKLQALSFRFTPLIKTRTPGLDSFDICLNSLCGDPDRWLRTGILFDARVNKGWYQDSGLSPGAPTPRQDIIRALNRDYARVGYRAGFLGSLRIIPDFPFNFWAAYTDFAALEGFKGDLGEVQTQVNLNLGSGATLAFTWRNGRREDTAKRDSTYALTVGFKNK